MSLPSSGASASGVAIGAAIGKSRSSRASVAVVSVQRATLKSTRVRNAATATSFDAVHATVRTHQAVVAADAATATTATATAVRGQTVATATAVGFGRAVSLTRTGIAAVIGGYSATVTARFGRVIGATASVTTSVGALALSVVKGVISEIGGTYTVHYSRLGSFVTAIGVDDSYAAAFVGPTKTIAIAGVSVDAVATIGSWCGFSSFASLMGTASAYAVATATTAYSGAYAAMGTSAYGTSGWAAALSTSSSQAQAVAPSAEQGVRAIAASCAPGERRPAAIAACR